jgi:hypothetical protein
MAKSDITSVDAAFEVLLEEIEGVIGDVNQAGARAFEQANLDQASEALEQAKNLSAFRSKLNDARKEWGTLYSVQLAEVKEQVSRRDLGRLSAGLRTQEEEYFLPILHVLREMGGRGEVPHLLDRVHQLMRSTLKPIDEEPLPSSPSTPRWRNTAQWARNEMVGAGLLKSGSPKGIWEITDSGLEYLAKAR